ncbi:alpha/beta hydrolase fold domain-containing protein, partial [Streptomyces sp. T-3]|nr:alpha/beta hydrolase fold domain-containing protein [Streptomyces sp. T-3]
GGNLAAVTAQTARDRGGVAPALQVLVYPATDMGQRWPSYEKNSSGYFLSAPHMQWFEAQYLGDPPADPADPRISPLRGDLTGLAPAHIVTAGCDPLCDEGRAYAAKLREAGVTVTEGHFPGMFHGFFGFPQLLPDAATAVAEVVEAVAATATDGKNSGEPGGSAG